MRRRAAAGPPDLDQYTWKSDSSQLLGSGNLRWGSNLFPSGVLFLLFGHLVGLLTPHFIHEPFLAASAKQMIAMIYGGLAGLLGFVAVSIPLLRDLARRQPPAGDHRDQLSAALDHGPGLREIQRHYRNILLGDIGPEVTRGPVGERKYADRLALADPVVQMPEFGPLAFRVPLAVAVAEGK